MEFSNRLAFAKDHKDVNEICLIYAATGAILARKDCTNDIVSPVDTFPKETFFPQTKYKENGSDYQILNAEITNPITDLTNPADSSHTR